LSPTTYSKKTAWLRAAEAIVGDDSGTNAVTFTSENERSDGERVSPHATNCGGAFHSAIPDQFGKPEFQIRFFFVKNIKALLENERAENISLKQDLDLLSQDRMTLVRELESAKSQIGQDGRSEQDKKATDKLLGLYIREVDKCIHLMQEIS